MTGCHPRPVNAYQLGVPMKPFFIAALLCGFVNAIAFWDEKHGIALSDPVDGRFYLIVTDDGGAKWTPLSGTSRPAALPKEGAFAASGTCLVTRGENDVWFCTGGARAARVFRSG